MKIRRKTFDLVLALGGAVLTVVLIAAGSLLLWGHSYANDNVHNQLAMQEIYFPPASAFAHAKAGTEITPGMKSYLLEYAGQEVLDGAQAEAYADHFIAVHLSEMPYHGVYSKVSAAARAAVPGSAQAAKLTGLETTVFQGTTLRGLLLEAYGFWTFGQIALIASVISFVLAGVMLVLTLLGLVHWGRVSEDVPFPKGHRQDEVARAA
ncbi:MAG: hypothetical protein ACYCU7_12305 [Acidimicrobiales bacterium]